MTLLLKARTGSCASSLPPAFAQKLRTLLATPEMLDEMRRASREKAGDFDLEKTVSAYESVLENSILKPDGRSGP